MRGPYVFNSLRDPFTARLKAEQLQAEERSMKSQSDLVRSVFQTAEWHLKAAYNIRIRRETVQEFLKYESFTRILDIGCGDGSLSLPLLTAERYLTLLDFSETMLSLVRSRIPNELADHVELLNQNVLSATLRPHSYDLILCVGVLAHVESPNALLEKIISWLKPGGSLILQNTEADHVLTSVARFLERIRSVLRPKIYDRNQLRSSELLGVLTRKNFDLQAAFSYGLPLLGMRRIASQETLYRVVRLAYGAYPDARLSSCGNECLYFLKARP